MRERARRQARHEAAPKAASGPPTSRQGLPDGGSHAGGESGLVVGPAALGLQVVVSRPARRLVHAQVGRILRAAAARLELAVGLVCDAALEDAATLVAKDKVAAAVHRVAARGLLHPPAALWALLEPLARCKLREGGVRGLGVAPLRLELLAAHAGVPRFGAAEEAETLGAEGALQLSVVRLPCKNKRAARRGAVPQVVLRLNTALQREPVVSLRLPRGQAALHVLRREGHSTPPRLHSRANELLSRHLARLNLAAHIGGEAVDAEGAAARRGEHARLGRLRLTEADWARDGGPWLRPSGGGGGGVGGGSAGGG
mmetsp:Transcript_18348/g.60507  ORF Transcript_18348/g.60507 Transcript_18348/m.60507 type:complete len:314 (+) Transcript_18348:218-1159(+)